MDEKHRVKPPGPELEYHCRDCDWYGGRGDLDVDQCPECGSFNIRTNYY